MYDMSVRVDIVTLMAHTSIDNSLKGGEDGTDKEGNDEGHSSGA